MPLWSLEHGGGEATDLVPLAAWLAARLLNGDALPPAGCSSRHLQSLVDALPSADWPPEFSPIKSFRLLDQALGEGAGFLLSHHSTIAGYGLGRPDFQTDPDEPHRPFATMARLPKL
jgi:hypothetical protein